MEKILITGGTGFVGTNLIHRLVRDGADAHCLVRPQSDVWRIRSLGKKIHVHIADLADVHAVSKVIKQVRPDIVYHLAAHGLFLKQEEAEQMIASNVLGTVNLLEALKSVDTARRIVNVGSFAEYDPDDMRIREDSVLRPSNAYGVSKASQSFFAQCYARLHKLPVVIIRPSLLYGPFEERRRLVPASALAHIRAVPLALSSPRPRKDFLFVEDAIDAFLAAAEREITSGEIINIGAGKEHSIKEVVMAVQRCVGIRVPFQWGTVESRLWDSPKKHVYDVSKAHQLLGWRATHSLEEGIRKTVEWFQQHTDLYT